MNKHQRKVHEHREDLLPYEVIQAATTGDPDAIDAVLRHYSGYITSMSLRTLHDRLEMKLIAGILAFRIA